MGQIVLSLTLELRKLKDWSAVLGTNRFRPWQRVGKYAPGASFLGLSGM